MKAAAMVTIVDMQPQIPGNEDVIAAVHVVAVGPDLPSLAADAGAKAMAILGKQALVEEGHAYHSVVNILGAIEAPSQIVIPGSAAAQAVLKSGEIASIIRKAA